MNGRAVSRSPIGTLLAGRVLIIIIKSSSNQKGEVGMQEVSQASKLPSLLQRASAAFLGALTPTAGYIAACEKVRSWPLIFL